MSPGALVVIYYITNSLITPTSAQYCEFGLCSSKEYCCGNNECCTEFNTWLLIGSLLLALTILSVGCACIYRYYCLLFPLKHSNSKLELFNSKTTRNSSNFFGVD